MSEKPKRVTGINPDLLVPENPNAQPLYEGENFKIIGPLKAPVGVMGLLQAKSAEVMKQMHVKRREVSQALNGNSLLLMRFVTSLGNEPPEAIVDLPPEHFMPMNVLATDEDSKRLVEEVMNREKERGIYTDDIKPSDFWMDPVTEKLFLFGLDKLK